MKHEMEMLTHPEQSTHLPWPIAQAFALANDTPASHHQNLAIDLLLPGF